MLDFGCWILDGGCYAEYLHINKHTFGARENIYYLLSLIHYLLSKNGAVALRFTDLRQSHKSLLGMSRFIHLCSFRQ